MARWIVVLLALTLQVAYISCQSVACSESVVVNEGTNLVLNRTLRTRRDWNDLSATDKSAYFAAFLRLHETGWLSQFQCLHIKETQAPFTDAIHRSSIFLLWHRIFLWHIETKLLALGLPGLCLLYTSPSPRD
eukprot:TRINITY_DN5281_c0_g1_i5.p1 TRINITY_DN5281_c0_g1~~TRINITY_DN5281_c0_g1_i5.p1  ORF type:complete len:133 (-),score=6.14 TRINITY_DN5281_c0_g1_i5:25-423(-)